MEKQFFNHIFNNRSKKAYNLIKNGVTFNVNYSGKYFYKDRISLLGITIDRLSGSLYKHRIIDILLENGADIENGMDSYEDGYSTCLTIAIFTKDIETIRKLLIRGANVDTMSAIEMARKHGNEDIVELIESFDYRNNILENLHSIVAWKETQRCDIVPSEISNMISSYIL